MTKQYLGLTPHGHTMSRQMGEQGWLTDDKYTDGFWNLDIQDGFIVRYPGLTQELVATVNHKPLFRFFKRGQPYSDFHRGFIDGYRVQDASMYQKNTGEPLRAKHVCHTEPIPKGVLGEFSKIEEEFAEMVDAVRQGEKLMILIEMADMLGAIQLFLERHFPGIDLEDIRKQAVINGKIHRARKAEAEHLQGRHLGGPDCGRQGMPDGVVR